MIRKDVSHCFSSWPQKHKNILFSALNASLKAAYIVSVCMTVSVSMWGDRLVPNEVLSYSHAPLSREM